MIDATSTSSISDSELSERELEILRLVATGATNAQIGYALTISPNTVKVHLRNIFSKLGVTSRIEATTLAIQRGWVTLPRLLGEEPAAVRASAVVADAPADLAGSVLEAESDSVLENGADVAAELAPPLAVWPVVGVPRDQRVALVVLALLCLGGLYFAWPRVEARGCAPGVASEHCAGSATPEASRWAARANMPTARGRLALAGIVDEQGGWLYAIGGETEAGVTGVVERFDVGANTWMARASKPLPVANVSAGVIDGRVYVPGGSTGARSATDALEIYDPATDRWTRGANLPDVRYGYALAVVGTRLYVIGGVAAGEALDTLIYDASSDTWTRGAPVPDGRAFSAAGVVDDEIYVFGGYDGARESAACARYRVADDAWSECAALNQARGGVGAAVVLERIYVLGGGWTGVLAFNERYDVGEARWTRFDTPVGPQWRNLGVAALGGDLFGVGGWDGAHYSSAVRQYQALYKTYLPATQH